MKIWISLGFILISAGLLVFCEEDPAVNVVYSLGEQYYLENAQKESVITTESGLQYEVLNDTTGIKPALQDSVTCHYWGERVDGYRFDSSYERGEPTTFALNRVIPGWQEGLQLMSVGSKYRFVIPPHLAYGAYGAGSAIGPYEYLVFEVELLGIISGAE